MTTQNAVSIVTKKKYVSSSRKYSNIYFRLTNEVDEYTFVHSFSKKAII